MNSDQPFQLTNEPQRKRVKFESDPARQNVLFSGLSCLSGQQDLFSTDGEDPSAIALNNGEGEDRDEHDIGCRVCGAPRVTRWYCQPCSETEAQDLEEHNGKV